MQNLSTRFFFFLSPPAPFLSKLVLTTEILETIKQSTEVLPYTMKTTSTGHDPYSQGIYISPVKQDHGNEKF